VVLRSPKAQAYSAPEVTSLRDIREKYAEVFGAEAVLPVAETEIGKLGCLVESEVMVPEAARLVASKGAEIIVHPTLERVEQHSPQAAMKQAAAYANGLYIVSAAAASEDLPAGSGQWRWIGGTSMIVGPDGAIDASLGKQAEGLLVGTIDPNRLDTARKEQARETTPAGVLYRELYAGLA
jgi:predicted amidohydrolase